MAAQKTKNEVATVDDKSNLPATYDYGEHAGAGFENTSKDDFSIPFFNVLQATSPEIETIDVAKPGMIINSVTKDLFKGNEGIAFIPVLTQHVFVEWKPREQGGGFVAVHQLDSDYVVHAKETQEFGEYKTPNGNDLVETFYVYGLRVSEDGAEQAVLAFTSTKIKKYKAWLTKARAIQIALPGGRRVTPPLFAHRYRVKTVKEKNNQGEFYNVEITFDGENAVACRLAPDSEYFQSALAVKTMVESGQAKAAYQTQDGGGQSESSGRRASASEEDAPF